MGKLFKVIFLTNNNSFFNKGFSSDIDEIQDKCDTVRRKLDAICKRFSKLCNQEVDVIFKLDYTDRDGYSLSGTQTRCKTLKAKIGNYSDKQVTIIPQELTIESKTVAFKNTTGSKTRIDSPEITGLCHEYRNLKIKIGNVARKLFGEVLRKVKVSKTRIRLIFLKTSKPIFRNRLGT